MRSSSPLFGGLSLRLLACALAAFGAASVAACSSATSASTPGGPGDGSGGATGEAGSDAGSAGEGDGDGDHAGAGDGGAGDDAATTHDPPGVDGGADPDAGGGPPSNAKRLFVTRATYDGALGGLAGADTRCQASADAMELGGTWRAWLSDESTAAPTRITGNGPWYEIGTNAKIFANKSGLLGYPLHAITRDEGGLAVDHGWWTGTQINGVIASGFTCMSWTSKSQFGQDFGTFGSSYSTGTPGAEWTDDNDVDCGFVNAAGLLCLEQ
jgi:hypothetical protein